MKINPFSITRGALAVAFALAGTSVLAATRYVDVNSANPTPPYLSWATAATVIQDAVDEALPGDAVVVTNGVYATGGRAVHEGMTNRVAVTKPLTLRSVNGPEVTVIRGYQVPGTTNGDSAVRCVYLTNGANLVGFTLTQGATHTFASGDFPRPHAGGGIYSESENATVSNCVLTGNSALTGGGAFNATLQNCVLSSNSAALHGGGANSGTLNNCVLMGNSATQAGGAFGGTLNKCLLIGNSVSWNGGGASEATLNNCVISGNSADGIGGGIYGGRLTNCTITGNSARNGGGAATDDTAYRYRPAIFAENCILHSNTATQEGDNYWGASAWIMINHSCTMPLPLDGTGNLTNAPLFVGAATGNFRLQSNSPCINAGVNEYAPDGTDLDGQLRIMGGRVDMGAFEFAPPVHYVDAGSTNPVPPYSTWGTAATAIQDAVDAALPGDEIVVTNGVYATGGRAVHEGMTNRVAVTKSLGLRSVNGAEVTVIRGYQVPGTTNGDGAVRCVYLTNDATLSGFTLTGGAVKGRVPLGSSGLPAFDWPLGGHELLSGGGVWCESVGAIVSHCVLSGNAAVFGGGSFSGTLNHSQLIGNVANGGGGAVRSSLNDCLVRSNSASLEGGIVFGRFLGGGAYFATLTRCLLDSNTAQNGGGAYASTLTRCAVTSNTATEAGGGTMGSGLFNCILVGNTAQQGGGAYGGGINNCTITRNSASFQGGGVWAYSAAGGIRGCYTIGCYPQPECLGCVDDGSIVNNSIVYENTAPEGLNHFGFTGEGYGDVFGPKGGKMDYSCTLPVPTRSIGNITNAPLFVDAAAGNFRLQSISPCINAGRNAFAPTGPDFDGNPRIVGGTVDMGAYEFQSPQSILSYAWLQQYGLPTDGSADFGDIDGDGQNNWQEWRAWTDPTNSLSALRLLMPVPSTNGLLVRWQSVSGQTYFVERAANVGADPAFAPLASNIVGQAGATIFIDTNAISTGPLFYRVGVQE